MSTAYHEFPGIPIPAPAQSPSIPRADRAALLARRRELACETQALIRAFEVGYAAFIDPAIRPGEQWLLAARLDATQTEIKAKLLELADVREALSDLEREAVA